MAKILLLISATLLSHLAAADWLLDEDSSSISFSSVKNGSIVESHIFDSLSGQVETDGTARLVIDLASVDTMIPIRDERMRDMLFEVADYPEAVFETSVPLRNFANIEVGTTKDHTLAGTLTLHGQSAEKRLDVRVTKTGNGRVTVSSVRPIVISAAEFALSDGIKALAEIAGLNSIVPNVPVSFSLLFVSDSIHE